MGFVLFYRNLRRILATLAFAVAANVPAFNYVHGACLRGVLEAISTQVKDSPELAALLSQMSQDPDLPAQFKRIIRNGLVVEGTTIGELTEAIRKENHLPESTGAIAFRTSEGIVLPATGRRYVAFPIKARDADGQVVKRNHSIAIQLNLDPKLTHPALALLHELAHVKFIGFLDRHFQSLIDLGHIPAWALQRTSTGRYLLDGQFLGYVNERYAYETEYRMFQAGKGRSFNSDILNFKRMGITDSMSESEVSKKISDFIFERYPFDDPRLKQYESMPISQIMMGTL